MDPNLSTIETGFAADVGAFGGGDDAPRAGDIEGVGARGRTKIGANAASERSRRSHLDEPEPDCEIFGPVPHNEGDGLSGRNARLHHPTRILVHARRERAEAKTLPIAHER